MQQPVSSAPMRFDVARLVTQIRRMEARSGRRAAGVFVAAPTEIDAAELVGELQRQLDLPELEIAVEVRPGAAQLLTVDFALPREVAR